MNKRIFSAISLFLLLCWVGMAQTTLPKSVFGQSDEQLFNFEGKIYYLPEGSYKLPDFTKLTPVGKIYTNYLNIENYHFEKVGQITMSIGVSQMKEGVDLDTLINNADNAMYFAKENGRNRVVTFSKIS